MENSENLSDLDNRLRVEVDKQCPDADIIRGLVRDGANPSQRSESGESLLSRVIWNIAESNDISTARLLLELGADVNNAFHDEERPIQDSMYQANLELFTLLMDAGADVNFLLDETESLLDWAEFDRRYHAHHSSDDERDREIVRFFDAAIPILKAKGAKHTSEFLVTTPKKYVRVSHWGLWTASGNLLIDSVCADRNLIARFEAWKSRDGEVWPEGPMPDEFDRHSFNMEGLSISTELRRHISPEIEVRFSCLDPVPCWWFQRNGSETVIPLDAAGDFPLGYETGETHTRGDVVITALFDVERNMLRRQTRILAGFQPLPLAFNYPDIEAALRSTGDHCIQAWNAKDWDGQLSPVQIVNNGEMFEIHCIHPQIGCSATVSCSSMAQSMDLPDGRMNYMMKNLEYALWRARGLKDYHSETTFYY